MKKEAFSHLDLDIYSKTLYNGLKVYVIPKNNVNNIYATFSTNYGATTNEFIPINEKEIIRVPDGIAHFLEHKVFEQEDGTDPLNFFTSNGANGNANTTYFKTTYLFSGTENFEENMNYLLDYVQSPYFTDDNVEKEKGIIEQEINMYLDNPYNQSYEKMMTSLFSEHPIKNNVIGSVKSIRSITKEDLYNCYNTFYHPSNMFVVVTGNVDAEKTIELIEKNQSKKDFEPLKEITSKTYEEPDNVAKEEEYLKMNITIPKILIGYKINLHTVDVKEYIFRWYLSIFANIKFGPISLFWEKMKEEKIVTEYINYSLLCTDDHAALILDSETDKVEELISRIKEEVPKFNISEEDFNRSKKSLLSSCIYMSDNIYSLNQTLMSDLIDVGYVRSNLYDEIKELNYEDFKNIIQSVDFNNNSVVVVEPKNK